MNTNTTWTFQRVRRGLFAAVFGLCGAASSVSAQSPGRSAVLLPPQPATESEARTIARGAIDDGPSDPLATSPVLKKPATDRTSTGPAWLKGKDSGVKPASATSMTPSGSEQMPIIIGRLDEPAPAVKRPSMFDRGMERIRSVFTSDAPVMAPLPSSLPPMMPRSTVSRELPSRAAPGWDTAPPRELMTREAPQYEVPSANSPLQGVSPSGTPVLAGPPAYRWYGYGTTTPGSNPFSPSGQYPRASANWYNLTGATPGAFPVPVTAQEAGVGIDPPTYRPPTITRISTTSGESGETMPASMPSFAPILSAPTPSFTPTPTLTPPSSFPAPPSLTAIEVKPSRTMPPPATPVLKPAAPTPIATSTAPAPFPPSSPVFMPSLPALPQVPSVKPPAAVPMPVLPPAPISRPQPTSSVVPPLLPRLPDGQDFSAAPPKLEYVRGNLLVGETLPQIPDPPVPAKDPASPAPLPMLSVTPISPLEVQLLPRAVVPASEEHPWQTTPERIEGSEGWMPSDGMPRQQSRIQHPDTDVEWQKQVMTTAKAPIIRGQAPDRPAMDPVSTLIHGMLRGRADGVDVRWQDERRVMVCFEAPSSRDASRLVQELSARPELAPLQIDFCVVVK